MSSASDRFDFSLPRAPNSPSPQGTVAILSFPLSSPLQLLDDFVQGRGVAVSTTLDGKCRPWTHIARKLRRAIAVEISHCDASDALEALGQ